MVLSAPLPLRDPVSDSPSSLRAATWTSMESPLLFSGDSGTLNASGAVKGSLVPEGGLTSFFSRIACAKIDLLGVAPECSAAAGDVEACVLGERASATPPEEVCPLSEDTLSSGAVPAAAMRDLEASRAIAEVSIPV